jgi:Uma2 family endonuclease
VTYVDADLLARAQHAVEDLLPKDVYVEVLEGMLVVNPPPSFAPAKLTERLGDALKGVVPRGLMVNRSVMGVYQHDSPDAEHQVPDIVVYRAPRPGTARLVGSDVELVVEVVSPANRRQNDYPGAVAARAERYGIPWVLVVDPDERALRWFHRRAASSTGPDWATLDADAVFG